MSPTILREAGYRFFHWPDLDVDLSLESIEHPERFPLVSPVGT